MLFITLFSPFLASLIAGLFGRYLGYLNTKKIVIFNILISVIGAYAIFYDVVILGNEITLYLSNWLYIENLDIDWAFNIDKLSGSMLVTVTTISLCVHIFAYSYMSSDPHQPRFFSYLSLFTFFMLILVTGNNYLTLFVGWEFIGVTSYLLISFWFTRINAMKSALSAVLVNRLGDTFFIIGMLLMFSTYGSLNFNSVFILAPYISSDINNLIIICFGVATMAKSAQFGLHVWLLQSMEGPTPVSSLLHAATLVTAGVYLLMRSCSILEFSPTMLTICLWVGAITTAIAGLIAIVSNDIKRVIALSTMSQLARDYIFVKIKNIFRNQTICVDTIICFLIVNSQITKARNFNKFYYYYINYIIYNSFPIMWQYILYIKKYIEQWNYIILSKLVGISEAIRLILIFFLNIIHKIIIILDNYTLSSLHINNYKKLDHIFKYKYKKNIDYNKLVLYKNFNQKRFYSTLNEDHKIDDIEMIKFNEWLAGLIDGDGYFNLSKKGIARLQITISERDKEVLYLIQQKYGGSIRKIANANAYRYQLSNRKGLINLINGINGLIRNPTRMLQMNKLCIKYDIKLIFPQPLTFYNGWLSGFIDSDGSIYLGGGHRQMIISASQKNNYLLEPLIKLYGGKISPHGSKDAYVYKIYRKLEVLNLIDNYFVKYPLKSKKKERLAMIKDFYYYTLHNYMNSEDINKFNEWIIFKEKWDKFNL